MKRTGLLLCLMLMVTPLTGCNTEPIEILPAVTSESETIECTVDGFYDTSEEKHHTSYNVGYGHAGGKSGYAIVPNSYNTVETKRYVYLKNNNGSVASFEISADCEAALARLEGKNITLTYTTTENVVFTSRVYKWNDFELKYSALVESANDVVTTAEQESTNESMAESDTD